MTAQRTPTASPLPPLLALLGGAAFAACQWLVFCYAPVEPRWDWRRKFSTSTCHVVVGAHQLFCPFSGIAGEPAQKFRSRRPPLCGRVGNRRAAGRSGPDYRHDLGPSLVGRLVDLGPAPQHNARHVVHYAGYLVLRGLDIPAQRKRRVCAVVGIVAFLDVPLVFLSARLWRSIHPAVFATRAADLNRKCALPSLPACSVSACSGPGCSDTRAPAVAERPRRRPFCAQQPTLGPVATTSFFWGEGKPLISAVDARSFLRRNGHGLRPPSGRCWRERVFPSPQAPHPFPSALFQKGTGYVQIPFKDYVWTEFSIYFK